MKKNLITTFLFWLPFAAMITFICLLGYTLVQQDIRIGANDPQIQMAEDVAGYLQNGATPNNLIPSGSPQVDITRSLDPYIIIFDASGKVLASSVNIAGASPTVPTGV